MKVKGNSERIKNVMLKASEGKAITIGFIGGSITQGAVASSEELCYAALVYKWWNNHFEQADVRYVNAGIGATTSQFGAARVKDDLLSYKPDLIFLEYSVNDNDEKPYDRDAFFMETYEGLIRKIYADNSSSAIIIINSVRYDDGSSMEEVHAKLGEYYDIPCISMKEMIYDKIKNNSTDIKIESITQDMLHPNDYGHGIVAQNIIDYLEEIKEEIKEGEKSNNEAKYDIPTPLTANRYELVSRYNNKNAVSKCEGFWADEESVMEPFYIDLETVTKGVKKNVKVLSSEARDVFKNGWRARNKGAYIEFEIKGTEIAVMYRKSVKKPAPVAYAILDGNVADKVKLDANFEEDWGDKAYMATIAHHAEDKTHILRIEIEEAADNCEDFYLINLIGQ